jgi:hypothetical protein
MKQQVLPRGVGTVEGGGGKRVQEGEYSAKNLYTNM